jgi:putative hemin transport protein
LIYLNLNLNVECDMNHELIRPSFAAARQRGLRAKEAAEAIGITEGMALAAHTSTAAADIAALPVQMPLTTWALRPEWLELLKSLESCGPLMALTRNDSTVHEKVGIYTKLSGNDHVALALGDIDLRLFFQKWAAGFLVAESGAASDSHAKTSLQFFDARGVAVHKIFPTQGTQRGIWDMIVESWVDIDRTVNVPVTFDPHLPPETQPTGEGLDAAALAADWAAMTDTHAFFGLLKKHKIERQHAFRAVQGQFSREVPTTAVRATLFKAAFDGLPIMVFVGNVGCIQIHSGPVVRIEPMDIHGKQWLNVLDKHFNLHLREDHIAHCWVIEKPTEDGIVSSLEVFDTEGELMVMLFGVRKPGQPELQGWKDVLAELPSVGQAVLMPA